MAIELTVPSVGESITEVEIGAWLKKPGDFVEKDEAVVEIESDKATVEVSAPAAGTIKEIVKDTGSAAEVGDLIGYLEEGKAPDKDEPKTKSATESGAEHEDKQKESGQPEGESEAKEGTDGRKEEKEDQPQREKAAQGAKAKADDKERAGKGGNGGEALVMPGAARLLSEHGLNAGEVKATGPGGRLLKEDVQRHVQNQPAEERPEAGSEAEATPKPSGAGAGEGSREEETVRMTPLRRTAAETLVRAQQTMALLTTFNECDMTEVIKLREQYKDAYAEEHDIKLGFMSFFVKAVIEGLKAYPAVNAEIRDENLVYKNYYDIGIAVSGKKGLVVPVMRNAERMSFAEIELAINDMGRRAREGKVHPDELHGGTFTITNGGIFGSMLSTPIVNPPQSAILGMHNIQERAVVRDGEIVARPMMYVALTYDHRIIDGREAVSFLVRVKECIEDPTRILLEI